MIRTHMQWYRWGRLYGIALLALVVFLTGGTHMPTLTHAADAPLVVKSGTFVNVTETGSGTATVYQLADGSYILRFEDFRVDNGPDLRVQLVTDDGTALDLGGLKGNRGNQNYALPADFDPAAYGTARIYCRAIRTVIITAPLTIPAGQ